jgi:hypothetical protein
MEMKVQIPFQQLLTLIKSLTPTQKARLRQELISEDGPTGNDKDEFIDFLLDGPVYGKKDIAVIEENRKSIAAWRTKN